MPSTDQTLVMTKSDELIVRIDERVRTMQNSFERLDKEAQQRLLSLEHGSMTKLDAEKILRDVLADADGKHGAMWEAIKAQGKTIDVLVQYKSRITGAMVALGVIAPIVTSIITAWLVERLFQ